MQFWLRVKNKKGKEKRRPGAHKLPIISMIEDCIISSFTGIIERNISNSEK
jgi:hypothetical protein